MLQQTSSYFQPSLFHQSLLCKQTDSVFHIVSIANIWCSGHHCPYAHHIPVQNRSPQWWLHSPPYNHSCPGHGSMRQQKAKWRREFQVHTTISYKWACWKGVTYLTLRFQMPAEKGQSVQLLDTLCSDNKSQINLVNYNHSRCLDHTRKSPQGYW